MRKETVLGMCDVWRGVLLVPEKLRTVTRRLHCLVAVLDGRRQCRSPHRYSELDFKRFGAESITLCTRHARRVGRIK